MTEPYSANEVLSLVLGRGGIATTEAAYYAQDILETIRAGKVPGIGDIAVNKAAASEAERHVQELRKDCASWKQEALRVEQKYIKEKASILESLNVVKDRLIRMNCNVAPTGTLQRVALTMLCDAIAILAPQSGTKE